MYINQVSHIELYLYMTKTLDRSWNKVMIGSCNYILTTSSFNIYIPIFTNNSLPSFLLITPRNTNFI